MSTGFVMMEGTASADGKTITLKGQHPEPGGEYMTHRAIWKIVDSNTQTFDMYGTNAFISSSTASFMTSSVSGRELEQRGHRFRTHSDSEIALHLYEDFGAHCLQHLRGEFAFVLWDETNQMGVDPPLNLESMS